MREAGRTALVEWAAAARALPGEDACGDVHLVGSADGLDTLAVIDGLGHGAEAQRAAELVREYLAGHIKEPLLQLVKGAHEASRGTRGAAASLARIGPEQPALTWLGVGNVTAIVVPAAAARPRETLANRGGVVGYKIPPLALRSLKLVRGDTVVLTTDGLRSGYAADAALRSSPDEAAHAVIDRFAKPDDDALVLVARYWGKDA